MSDTPAAPTGPDERDALLYAARRAVEAWAALLHEDEDNLDDPIEVDLNLGTALSILARTVEDFARPVSGVAPPGNDGITQSTEASAVPAAGPDGHVHEIVGDADERMRRILARHLCSWISGHGAPVDHFLADADLVMNDVRAAGLQVSAVPPDSEWVTHMRSMLAKPVVVTLQREPQLVEVTGELISFEDSGEVILRGDDGFARWLWPALDVRLANPGDRDQAHPSPPDSETVTEWAVIDDEGEEECRDEEQAREVYRQFFADDPTARVVSRTVTVSRSAWKEVDDV